MSNKTTKRLSSKGSLTIPSNIRAKYGYIDKGFVSIVENEDGSLVIKPTQRGCFFCTEPTEILYMGTPICKSCAEKISKLVPVEPKATSKSKKAAPINEKSIRKTSKKKEPSEKVVKEKPTTDKPFKGEITNK